ncbi:MAG TPA: uroporphyrinogen-III C-methyltransferase [Polyangia bacterium]
MDGFVYLVGAGPGDPGLVTLRAVEALGRADVVIADRLVADEIIRRHAPPACELITRPARKDGLDQEEINALLVERARRGQVVVRLKGGDPFVFGRGGEEAEALVDAGVPFVVVPGVTAAVAAPAYAGIPLTHRGLAGAVAFATGHESDDKSAGAVAWSELSRSAATLVLYMSVSRLGAVMERLIAAGRAPSEPVAIVERGTTLRQRVIAGTIADIAARALAADVQPPALTIVGEVVRLRERIAWFERRRRILVLTTKDDAVTRDDVDVVRVSPLQVVPRFAEVKAAIARLTHAKTIAFASAHAVDVFLGALASAARDARSLHGVTLAAVGRATAARLAERSLAADYIGDGGGADLAAALVAGSAQGPALVIGAHDGRKDLADALAAAGWTVEPVAAYDTVADDTALAAAWKAHRARPFHAVAFTSPKGAHAFFALANAEPAAALAGVRIGAIGATTRDALLAAGLAVDAVPATPDVAALVTSLAALPKIE